MNHSDFEQLAVSVGPDALSEYDSKSIDIPVSTIEWVVYAYEIGSYDGSGTIVIKLKSGKYLTTNLGHCSCYGPVEKDDFGAEISLSEMLLEIHSEPKDYDYKLNRPVEEWVQNKNRK